MIEEFRDLGIDVMRSRPPPHAASAANTATALPPIDAALLEEWALSYLGRYASSAANLRQVLRRRLIRRIGPGARIEAALAEDIDALIARYRSAGLLDDPAYAAGRARRDLARGRSLRQIAAGLAAKGIGSPDAAAALAALHEHAGDPELAAAASFARRRRLGPYRRDQSRSAAADAEQDRRRALGAFARAGFARAAAEAILACDDAEAVAALLAERA